MILDGLEYPNLLIKVSKREYLEDIKSGRLYFNDIDYFRNLESADNTSVADLKEGKTKLDFKSTLTVLPDYMKLLEDNPPEDFNFSILSHKDIPIFCCSLVDESILVRKNDGQYDFDRNFIKEMKSWGRSVLVVSLEELLFKVNQKCQELGLDMIADKIKYDQDINEYKWDEYVERISGNPLSPIFCKTEKYKRQNEFRIALLPDGKLLGDNHFLNIGILETATILNLSSLKDLGIKVVPSDKTIK